MSTPAPQLDEFGHRPGCVHYGKKPVGAYKKWSHTDLFCTCHNWTEPMVLDNGSDIAWPAHWTQAQADVWRVEHDLQRPAATVSPAGARNYVGKCVTVEGVASVHALAGGMCFIHLGSRDTPFAAVIPKGKVGRFPHVQDYDGKTLDVSGIVELRRDLPEIVLKSPSQIIAR